ncbi:TetR/AcrR family transcriptional regulator [Pengzhenrongella sicca]|uniref:TetR/AcrR family transcriptional regulator n=1 Tax=Pengzhenrongella sicca TaxID=2819238 RepID=A0A8A4ZBV1_9MICO|nr:TetR/AcrR family transcriptional regulator [Pengzhenrongella sicca]QTE27977.1 TetR/AcrR family transcriptional regulator [Pengzhenrongella sicca]
MTVAAPAALVGRPTRAGGQSPVASRILAVAGPLFYADGIRAISADRIIAGAGVTKATFYRHFPTKDHLVVAYLGAVADAERLAMARWRADLPGRPGEVLRAYARALGDEACGPGHRGCPFLNAMTEYPEPAHPVRVVVARHRRWLRDVAAELVAELGVDDPPRVALQLVLLRDGAMSWAADPEQDARAGAQEVSAALLAAGRAVVGAGALS